MIAPNVGTPKDPTLYSKLYARFKGVDFTTDPSRVDDDRSPDALNIISDSAGFPAKRVGWRELHDLDAQINGLYYIVFASGDGFLICHAGTKLYKFTDTSDPVEICTGIADRKIGQFTHNGAWYLLDGVKYKCVTYDAEEATFTVTNVESDPYVPTVAIGITGDSVETDATLEREYEAPNLLTVSRKALMAGDGTSKIFYLTEKDITAITSIKANGTETTAFTADAAAGMITFTTAPEAATPAGESNIEVLYTKPHDEGWGPDCINRCTMCAQFGFYNDNRMFVSGDESNGYVNVDYMSGTDEPNYFPTTGWVKVGTDVTPIMGYVKQYDSLLIIKADNDQDAQMFVRSAEQSGNGMLFPVKQGAKGVGAISRHAIGTIRDDPVFLAREGVFGIISDEITNNKGVQERSRYVNPRLCAESGLNNAVSVTWGNYWVLCVNGHCYIADAQQKAYGESTAEFNYEWYYWTNVPARVFLEQDGCLYFGTAAGRICKFNTDIENDLAAQYADNGAAITARWSTKMDSFGTQSQLKTMTKKGCTVLIKPYARSSAIISAKTDSRTKTMVKTENADILDFADIQFGRISFNATDAPTVIALNTKVKKFCMLQIIVENNTKGEGFGVYGIQLQYVVGNFIK